MKAFSCVMVALVVLFVSFGVSAAEWICVTGESFTLRSVQETLRVQAKKPTKDEAVTEANGLFKARSAAFDVANRATPAERRGRYRYPVMCWIDGQPMDPRVAKMPQSTWPRKSGAQAAIKLNWDPWKHNPVAIKLKEDSAYEWGVREWIVVANPEGEKRYTCKKELLFKRLFATSSGFELGSEVFRRDIEQSNIRGPRTNADSQAEKALRWMAGNGFHIVSFGGDCWQDGAAKPAQPTSWSGKSLW